MSWLWLCITLLSNAYSYEYGIDRLSEPAVTAKLQGRSLAVLTHAASVDHSGHHLIDLLYPRYLLKKIFVPEHGLRSVNDGWVGDGVDDQTHLPVISLYKQNSRAPRPEDLMDVDAIVVDLQDVGVRYYTYFSSLAEFMKVAASLNKEVILLDRPNPLGGIRVEGETLAPELMGNFISYFNVPTRHGMTIGELALLFVSEKKLDLKLTIIPVKGWAREAISMPTERSWIPSSPALLTLQQVFLYGLLGSLEQFNLAVGRGSENSQAFHVFAAPWITSEEAESLVQALNDLHLAGLIFSPTEFTVTRDQYLGQKVRGVRVDLVEGMETARSDEITFKASSLLVTRFPALRFSKFAPNYFGSESYVKDIQDRRSWETVLLSLDSHVRDFKIRRTPYLLY